MADASNPCRSSPTALPTSSSSLFPVKGELALAFGELLRKLYAPGWTEVAPWPFKSKLARFAPHLSGYNQHDSQELLAFLLDGHEDLNRDKHKPYIKYRDADGRPDEEAAHEYWENHIACNDSIIVDVCQGHFRDLVQALGNAFPWSQVRSSYLLRGF